MRTQLTLMAKKALAPLIFRHRPVGLSAGRLYLYLDALYRTQHLEGAVVEIGCNVGGTASLGNQMLRKMRSKRSYLCIDTFAGFVEEQYAEDVRRGNSGDKREAFSANDMELARQVLNLHGGSEVDLLQADVCSLSPDRLPEKISVCLIDVDLYEPILAGLEKVFPRLEPGGIILVDDCLPRGTTSWQAGQAFSEFTAARSIEHRVEFGMGVLTAPARGSS